MRRLIVLSLVATTLAGCQATETGQPQTPAIASAPLHPVATIGEPSSNTPSKIGLLVKKGPLITVGYPKPGEIFDKFKTTGVFGSEYNDLPTKFGYPYRARTWETAKTGFGEVLYNDTLVAAVYHVDRATIEQVQDLKIIHQNELDGVLPDFAYEEGKRVNYWIWNRDKQRLMICAYRKDEKDPMGFQLTVAMGDDVVMDGLDMSPDSMHAIAAKVDAAANPDVIPTNPKVIRSSAPLSAPVRINK